MLSSQEERSSLNSQVFRLEKEKASLELLVNNKDGQMQAYLAQIEHLKSELHDQKPSPTGGATPPPIPIQSQQPVPSASSGRPQPMVSGTFYYLFALWLVSYCRPACRRLFAPTYVHLLVHHTHTLSEPYLGNYLQ